MLNYDGKDADDEDEEENPKPAKVYTISQSAPEEPATSAQGPDGQVIYFPYSFESTTIIKKRVYFNLREALYILQQNIK